MIDTFQFNMHLKLTLIIEGECIIQEILSEAKEMLRGSTINLGGSLILEYLDFLIQLIQTDIITSSQTSH